MKKIHNYNQFINENVSFDNDISKMIKLLGENLPAEFYKVLEEYKPKLKGFVKRFSTDGVADVDKIKLAFNVNEGVFSDAWNELLKLKYYIPIGFLLKIKDFLIGVWDFIIEDWDEGGLGKLMVGLKTLLISIVVLFVSLLIQFGVLATDKVFNGLDNGIVKTEIQLTPAHTNTTTTYQKIGSVTIPTTTTINVPDTWKFDVVGLEGDRVETWTTTSKELSNVQIGDTLDFDNYSWDMTK